MPLAPVSAYWLQKHSVRQDKAVELIHRAGQVAVAVEGVQVAAVRWVGRISTTRLSFQK